MKAIRILALLLAVLMLVSVVVACGGGDETTTTTTVAPADPTPPPSGKTLAQALVEAGFGVVGGEHVSDEVNTATATVISKLKEIDKWISVDDDFFPAEDGAKEIIIGTIRRAASQTLAQSIAANRVNSSRDWQIKITQDTVLVVGLSDAGLCDALARFTYLLTQDSAQYYPSYDSGVQNYQWPLTQLGNQPIQNYKIVLPTGANAFYQTQAAELQQAVFTTSGYTLPIIDDTQSAGTTELVVGETTRPVSLLAKQTLQASRKNHARDGMVKATGTQVALLGMTEPSLQSTLISFAGDYFSDSVQAQVLDLSKLYQKEGMKTLAFGQNDASEYRIVYAEDALYEVRLAAYQLKKFLFEQCGYNVQIVTDATAPVGGQKEILLGHTNRTASTSMALEAYQATIDANGNFCVNAGHYAGVSDVWKAIQAQITAQSAQPSYSVSANISGTVDTQKLALTWQADKQLGDNESLLRNFDYEAPYTLTWSDEFDGDSLDLEIWTIMPTAPPASDQLVRADEEHIQVSDGVLRLIATMDESLTATPYITAPDLCTADKMNYSGGYMELRSILPYKGAGEFTSYWFKSDIPVLFMEEYRRAHNDTLIDNGYFVEVDVFETVSQARGFCTTLHKWPNGKNAGTPRTTSMTSGPNDNIAGGGKWVSMPTGADLTAMHTYGFLWTDDIMAFSIDGKFFYSASMQTSNNTNLFQGSLDGMSGFHKDNMALYPILGHGVATPKGMEASSWVGGCRDVYDEDILYPLTWTVDYLRLYQTTGEHVYTADLYEGGVLQYDSGDWQYALEGIK